MFRAPAALACLLLVFSAGCGKEKVEPLQLQGNLLKVVNDTDEEWKNVELWLNWYYRAGMKSIPAHSRADATLDMFVEGYGRRFNAASTQVKDLKLKAVRANGEPLELTYHFKADNLNEALGKR
jgi:hypothetical protein